ncbi:MAG: hypothetical protein JXJ04_23880 [Spirochaetales bacterium]|nr:hypothetical protein [Spirochaetales bacterium]
MFNFKLQFNPKWGSIVSIRKFIISILSKQITNHDEAYRVALVATELLENVCRYSTGGMASIILKQGEKKSEIELSIRNITNKENFNNFKKIFEIISEGSATEAYMKMMVRIVNAKDNKFSQLGLARIRYEGQSELAYEIDPDITSLMEGTEHFDNDNSSLVLCVKNKMSIIPKNQGETYGI